MTDQIDNTIFKQLIGANKVAVMSWGAHHFTIEQSALIFKVQARRYRGWIKIEYDGGADLYNIYFPGLWWKKSEEKPKTLTGIYFDCMTEIIDDLIERVPEYNR